ncbi:hypothetical protein D9758_013589 [Tetrapyrgos nigripes]|uniref:Uncharacterized protein n=1 Tax=Tetrapyrgos nigripes TaxID=182062 RepID=A0A8H5FHJ1_9AGAR|nr:hypothetical protein D9758_013589 [Tetrapyrgos nigripes]
MASPIPIRSTKKTRPVFVDHFSPSTVHTKSESSDHMIFEMSPFQDQDEFDIPEGPPSPFISPPQKKVVSTSTPPTVMTIKPRPVHKITGFTPDPSFSRPTSPISTPKTPASPASCKTPWTLPRATRPTLPTRTRPPRSARRATRPRNSSPSPSHPKNSDSSDSDLDYFNSVDDFKKVLAYRLERRRPVLRATCNPTHGMGRMGSFSMAPILSSKAV